MDCKSAIAVVAAAVLVSCGEATQPNILLVVPDDVALNDWDLGVDIELPSYTGGDAECSITEDRAPVSLYPTVLDFKDEAVSFSNFYSQSSCGPSRLAFMTGRRPSESVSVQAAATPGEVTVPTSKLEGTDITDNLMQSLKALGYTNGMAGKFHLGTRPTSLDAGFDSVREFYANNVDGDGGEFHQPEAITNEALRFIKEYSTTNPTPWFFYAAYTIAHSSASVTDSLQQAAVTAQGEAVNWAEHCTSCVMQSRDDILTLAGADTDKKLGIAWFDNQFNALLTQLEEQGVADNTLVVLMGENGFTKNTVYEQGSHSYLMMRLGSRWKGGKSRSELVAGYEVPLTLLQVAAEESDVDAPLVTEHSGFLNVLDKKGRRPRTRTIFLEAYSDRAVLVQKGKRTRKLIYKSQDNVNPRDARLASCYEHYAEEFQLYDLKRSPDESELLHKNRLLNKFMDLLALP